MGTRQVQEVMVPSGANVSFSPNRGSSATGNVGACPFSPLLLLDGLSLSISPHLFFEYFDLPYLIRIFVFTAISP